jgi:4-azaleucine resistance transporter AzlC
MPVILGYLPAGFAFGLMMSSIGRRIVASALMAVIMYAGAGQYIAVDFIKTGSPYLTVAIGTFLVNSKHLFYGLSLLEPYKKAGKRLPFLAFMLTDETYALLTGAPYPEGADTTAYITLVSVINYIAWISGCVLGAIFGKAVRFDTTGLDFAMTALFLVILVNQLKSFRTRLPFIIGTLSALSALFLLGKGKLLLGGAALSVLMLIIFRRQVERSEEGVSDDN